MPGWFIFFSRMASLRTPPVKPLSKVNNTEIHKKHHVSALHYLWMDHFLQQYGLLAQLPNQAMINSALHAVWLVHFLQQDGLPALFPSQAIVHHISALHDTWMVHFLQQYGLPAQLDKQAILKNQQY